MKRNKPKNLLPEATSWLSDFLKSRFARLPRKAHGLVEIRPG
jgi:hypothetical protein